MHIKRLLSSRRFWINTSLALFLVAFCVIPGTGGHNPSVNGNAYATPEIPPSLIPLLLGVSLWAGICIRRKFLPKTRSA